MLATIQMPAKTSCPPCLLKRCFKTTCILAPGCWPSAAPSICSAAEKYAWGQVDAAEDSLNLCGWSNGEKIICLL